MSRKVKLRAYLKAEDKICDVELIRPNAGAFLLGANLADHQRDGEGNIICFAANNGRFCKLEEFVLLLGSGRLDSNNHEIFEGDILTAFFEDDSGKKIQCFHQVFYSEADAALVIDESLFNDKQSYGSLGEYTLGDYSIAGNIFKNSDLLSK